MACMLVAAGAAAQGHNAPREPAWVGDATVATMSFSDSTSLGAVGGVIAYRPFPWLTLGAAPTVLQRKAGADVSSGFGDLPLVAAASTNSGSGRGLNVGAAVMLVLPTGNASIGLGSGVTSVGVDVGAGVSPTGRVHLSADASRGLSAVPLSSLDAQGSTWLDVDADVDLFGPATATASLGCDFGGADTTARAREVGAGLRYALRGPLTLSVAVTHRLAGDSPVWGLAVTLGTAGIGVSPLNSGSPLQGQRQVVGGGVAAACHGRSRVCP
ncbi:MAG: hypothetical protein E6K55_08745 [Gemmatimonadetes bacterium]|nr:MAG: hypothetical protein E6K55_08745 [Gemmatimonadota bacterium]